MAKKTAKKDGKVPAPAASGGVSRFQNFVTETVHRSQLKGADYNPRYLSDRARVKLKESLSRVGLVQPIVWNKKTGNIVGGHQRIKMLDSLEESADYSLTVAVVDVDDKREKELNVLLNNQEVSGEWDFEKLQEILNEVDLLNTGFDHAEFLRMFGEAPSQADNSHQDALREQAEQLKATYEKLTQAHRSVDDQDFYHVVVFGSLAERTEFVNEFGFENNRYIDGRTLLQLLRDLKQSKLPDEGAKRKAARGAENPTDVAGNVLPEPS